MLEKYPYVREDIKIIHKYHSIMIKKKGQLSLLPVNETALAVLRECDGTKTFQQIILQITQKYCQNKELGDFIEKMAAFFQELLEKGYIACQNSAFHRSVNLVDVSDICYPDNVVFELTDFCNLNCRHCYRNSDSTKSGYIDKERMLSAIEFLSDYGLKSVHLTGGEPGTHKDFLEIFTRTLTFCPRVIVLSNGTNFTERELEAFCTYRDRIKIQVDLDGPSADIHDDIRGRKGAFDKVTSFIRAASKRGIPIEIAMDVYEKNLEQMEQTVRLAKELGGVSFTCNPIMELGRGKSMGGLDDRQVTRFIQLILELGEKYEGFVQKADLTGEKLESRKNCGGGYRNIVCSPEGWIRPCILLPPDKKTMGNLLEDDLEELFARPIFKYFAELEAPNQKTCGDCTYAQNCKGCFSRPLTMEDKIKEQTPDLQCVYKERLSFLI